MAADYELTLNDYLQILRRRAYHIAGTFCVLFAITLVVTVAIPPVYQSKATVLIESPQIPADLLQGSFAIYADERIEVIKQRVMTHDNLLRIADRYNLYKKDYKKLTPSELIDEMRKDITVEMISAEKAKAKAVIAFSLSFDNRDPDVSQKVTNELVTLFLDENVKSRTERATQTNEFFDQEANRLKGELEKIESQVATYKQQHANALPEHLELRMSMMQRTESDIKDIEREYKDTQARLKYLDIELASAKAGVGSEAVTSGNVISPASELEKLQAEYTKLSATYSENHPDVRALKRKIQALEKSPTESATPVEKKAPSENVVTNLRVARVQAHIDEENARLTSLDQQRKSLRNKLEQLQAEVIQAPKVEFGMSTLLRDYENAKKKYEEIRGKANSATITTNLEQENKGERFSLIEPPMLPDKPLKPDRIKILLIGLVLSIGAAGGGVFMLESMGNRIWGVDALAGVIRQHPLATIPYITTNEEIVKRKRRLLLVAVAFIGALVAVAVLLQLFYMPLNVLLFKIAARFG